MKRIYGDRKSQGFTVLEFVVVLALSSIVLATQLPKLERMADDAKVRSAETDMRQILIQAREHRLATGAWPVSTAVLVSANRIPASAAVSTFGTPYVFTVTAGNNLSVRVDTGHARYATRMAGADLPFVERSGNRITSTVTPAGQEASTAALYALDGSRALTGAMNANSNNINNVGTLTADTGNIESINSTTITATDRITGSRVVATDRMISRNGFASESNPAYVVRPDGSSVIRNLSAEQIRGTYIYSSGNIEAAGNVTSQLNVSAAQDVVAGRDIRASRSIFANNNVTAAGQVQGETLIATADVRSANGFFDSNNMSYFLRPASTSILRDVTLNSLTAQNATINGTLRATNLAADNNLTVGNDASIGRNVTVANDATVANSLTASTLTATSIVRSRYGLQSLNNPSFVVIPDGNSVVANLNANSIRSSFIQSYGAINAAGNLSVGGSADINGGLTVQQGITGSNITATGNVTASNNVYGRRFIDRDDGSFYFDPSASSNIRNLSVQGSFELAQAVVPGTGCAARRVGLSSSGVVLSCVGGVWRSAAAGSTVITGNISNNQTIPLPSGFTESQCTYSASLKSAYTTANATRHGGGQSRVLAGRRFQCGIWDSGNYYSGSCEGTYIVACNS